MPADEIDLDPPDLIVTWDGPDDPENPFNFPAKKKWTITLSACYVCFIVGLNSTAIAGAAEGVLTRFSVSDDNFPNDYWPIAAWNAGAAFAPLFGVPLLEQFGVRTGFLLFYFLFFLFVIPQALANSFATLLVTRVIAGALASIVQNSVESVVADTFRTEAERNLPITLFVYAFLAGFTVGPVVGAAIASRLYWRWYELMFLCSSRVVLTNSRLRVFYIQLIIYGTSFPLLWLTLAETRHSVILERRAKLLSKRTGLKYIAKGTSTHLSPSALVYEAVARPTKLFLTEPVVFFFSLWSAFAFGLVFVSTQSIAQVYAANYGFSGTQAGYVQAALLVGETLGILAALPQNASYLRSAERNVREPGVPVPEARLPLSIPASFVGLCGGLFWYAWSSAHAEVHWIVPAVGLGFMGFGIMIVVHSVVMYLTDSYPAYAAQAISAEAFAENIFSAFLPLATKRMYSSLGFGWAGSLLGFLAFALSFAPIVLMLKGGTIRKRSKFMAKAVRD